MSSDDYETSQVSELPAFQAAEPVTSQDWQVRAIRRAAALGEPTRGLTDVHSERQFPDGHKGELGNLTRSDRAREGYGKLQRRKTLRTVRLCFLVLVAICAATGFLILLLGPVTMLATPLTGLKGVDKADAVNNTRQTLLAAVGGLVVLSGAAYTARSYYLGRRGQLTDRYAKAIALLASDIIMERVGGVYALEHLMIESDREHETVVEVLAAFIRERTSKPGVGRAQNEEHHHKGGDENPRPDIDVQAALTVIGRRPARAERNLVDLSHADLCGADLGNLDWSGVCFWGTKLRSATLIGANLKRTVLYWAQLQEANLSFAHLQRARLSYTQLSEAKLMYAHLGLADLTEANLRGAQICGAKLRWARLSGAQLQGANFISAPWGKPAPARGLTNSQIDAAVVDDATRLPGTLKATPRWILLIAQIRGRLDDSANVQSP